MTHVMASPLDLPVVLEIWLSNASVVILPMPVPEKSVKRCSNRAQRGKEMKGGEKEAVDELERDMRALGPYETKGGREKK